MAIEVPVPRPPTDWSTPEMRRRIQARYRSEATFKGLGLAALGLAAFFLAFLLFTIIRDGASGFRHSEVRLSVSFDPTALGIDAAAARGQGSLAAIRKGDFPGLMLRSGKQLGTAERVISEGAWLDLRTMVEADPAILGTTRTVWVPVTSSIDLLTKGKFDLDEPEISRGVSDKDVAAWRGLASQGRLEGKCQNREG